MSADAFQKVGELEAYLGDSQLWGCISIDANVADGSIRIPDGSVWGVRLIDFSGTPSAIGH